MRILTVGDVVGSCGVDYIKRNLKQIKDELNIDFIVINGENALQGSGINKSVCDDFFNADCDCITLGNHAFKNKGVSAAFEVYPRNLIRPLNYNSMLDGEGYTVLEKNGVKVAVINLLGRIYLENVDCPFKAADKALEYIKSKECNIIIVDFHACLLYTSPSPRDRG